MLYVSNIQLQHFKNYTQSEVRLIAGVNCFVGNNGAGKTNLLDALYYLSFTKSYFIPHDQQLIKHGHDWMRVEAEFVRNNLNEKVAIAVQQGKKMLKVNNNEVKPQSSHIGNYPLVMIAPNDILLILEGSEERRKYMDGIISQANKTYLQKLLLYNRVLESRNKLLKNFSEGGILDPELLDTYNSQLIQSGTFIHTHRLLFIKEFEVLFKQYYQSISQHHESVELVYESDLTDRTYSILLLEHEQADISAARTTKGIHKDDLDFLIDGRPLKKLGSQGQQKSYIIALKLAQYHYLKTHLTIKPLLLLDDIFEKLDGTRLQLLLQLIAEDNFGQIIISDTHIDRIKAVFNPLQLPVKYFSVENGLINEI